MNKNTALTLTSFLLLFSNMGLSAQQQVNTALETAVAEEMLPDSVQQWMEDKLAASNVKSLVDYKSPEFFRKDTAHLVGYLQGYHPGLGFTSGIIYAENVLTNEDFPLVVPIQPDGRFEVDVPANHPLYTHVVFNREWAPFYIEPGQTLAMILDWDEFNAWSNNEGSFPIRYKGTAARINSELSAVEIKRPSHNDLESQARTLAPKEFKEMHLAAWSEREAELENALAGGDFLPQTQVILKNEMMLRYAAHMFNYEMRRKYELRQDSLDRYKALRVKSDSTFYDFLQSMPLDDQSLLVSSEFSTFINRFEFGEPFLLAFSLGNDKKVSSSVERYLAYWKIKDSILVNYFKLQPGFVYEVSKTRSVNPWFQQVFKDKKDEARQFLTGLEKGISNAFLLMEAERCFRNAYPAVPKAAYTLPAGKATDIFNRMIAPHRGKVLFVDLWATTCGPCVASIKNHKDERKEYRGNPDFDFIFITSEDGSPEGSYNKFVSEQELEHTYRLSADDYLYLRQLFKFNGIPRYVLVGKDGSILNDDFAMYNFEHELKKLFPQYSDAGKK